MKMEDRIIISPGGKSISIEEMERIFEQGEAIYETIFRRLEFNRVIKYTAGTGIDIGCGLNKIHSAAIGIDFRLGNKDFGYPFGANIECHKSEEYLSLSWFAQESLEYVFSSHCLEHFRSPQECIMEALRVLKPNGHLVLILPHVRYYPKKGETGANLDHKLDYEPETLMKITDSIAEFDVIQLDTLHEALKDVVLTERDRKIAEYYGHKSLNFSFEAVFQKRAR